MQYAGRCWLMNWEKREMERSWLLWIPLRESGALRTPARTHAHITLTTPTPRGVLLLKLGAVWKWSQQCVKKNLPRFVVPNDTGRVVRLGGRRWSIWAPTVCDSDLRHPTASHFPLHPRINRDIIWRLVLCKQLRPIWRETDVCHEAYKPYGPMI